MIAGQQNRLTQTWGDFVLGVVYLPELAFFPNNPDPLFYCPLDLQQWLKNKHVHMLFPLINNKPKVTLLTISTILQLF